MKIVVWDMNIVDIKASKPIRKLVRERENIRQAAKKFKRLVQQQNIISKKVRTK